MRDSSLHLPQRRPVRSALLGALVLAGAFAALNTQTCPIDKTTMTATGETRQEDGKTLAEYKCEKGHVYWVAVD
jgi:ferric-dicitrate binding protein FerR (iron transport regulator)